MQFVSVTSTQAAIEDALDDVLAQFQARWDDAPLDLALVFVTEPFVPEAATVATRLQDELAPHHLIGCGGESVIGRDVEIEHDPGLTLIAAHLPEVEISAFHLPAEDWQLNQDPANFRSVIDAPEDVKAFILLADPFSTPTSDLLEQFNTIFEGVPIAGGIASAARSPGGNVLFYNDQCLTAGAVGVALAGNLSVDIIVSQGCRPIGDPLRVDEAQDNVIVRLDGQPPLVHLQKLLTGLPPSERDLLKNGVFIGRAVDSEQEMLGRGDFLIRGVMGIDQKHGALAVGDYVQPGEQVQFHVRDAATAEEDLSMMLAPQAFYDKPSGVFLFSCNGRGTRLYAQPNGDISTIQQALGEVEVAGFFAAGEIGPIGGQNFLHGHTASLMLFRPADDED